MNMTRVGLSAVLIAASSLAAWLAYDWTFTGKLANGQSTASKGWESQMYQKTDQGWRIAHLHYSVPPQPSIP